MANGDRLDRESAYEILLMEQRNELTPEQQEKVDDLRAAGRIPAPFRRMEPPGAAAGAGPTLSWRQTAESGLQGVREFVGETVKTGALPTAGGALGATVGGLVTLPLGGWGAVAGESLGSMLGEGANQALGITEPSWTQIGLAGAGGPILRAGQRAYRGLRPTIARNMPGAAPVLHEYAQETLEALPGRIRVGPAATESFWENVDRLGQGQRVISSHLGRAAQRLRSIYGKGPLADPEDTAKLDKILDWIGRHQNDVPFDEMDALRKQVGHLVRSADDKTANIGARLYAAIEDDYDAFLTLGGRSKALIAELTKARAATKSDLVADRIQTLVRPFYNTKDEVVVRSGALARKLRQDEFLHPTGKAARITPAQAQLVEDVLAKVKNLPAHAPPRGVKFGFGVGGAQAVVGAGVMGGLSRGDPALALGGAALGIGIPWMVAKIAQSPWGERRLAQMIRSTGAQIDARAIVGLYNAVLAQRPDEAVLGDRQQSLTVTPLR
jgi:hypothetical protein